MAKEKEYRVIFLKTLTSPRVGNVWLGREMVLPASIAEKFVNAGDADYITDEEQKEREKKPVFDSKTEDTKDVDSEKEPKTGRKHKKKDLKHAKRGHIKRGKRSFKNT